MSSWSAWRPSAWLPSGEAQTPLLLVVEDAHWLDRSSAEVLAFVARRLEMEPVILLFAVRDGVPSDLDEAGLPDLALAGLDDDASRTLLEVNGAGLSEELKGRILAEAAGNPLALIELPAAAVDLDLTRASEPLPLTARLEATFATRLTALDADVRALLLLAALHDGELAELSRAAEELLGARVDVDDWTAAVASGLGTLDEGGFRFRHPLMRSAVHQAATGEQRRLAHAALARRWQAIRTGPSGTRRRRHQGRTRRSLRLSMLRRIGRRFRGGLDVAFAALERAAGLTADPRLRALRLARAGDLAYQLGRSEEAVRLLRAALQLGRLPAHETVRASFDLETLTRAWSGASTIRRFARVAEDLADRGDDEAELSTHWVRCRCVPTGTSWTTARGNTCRRSSSGSRCQQTTLSVWRRSGSSIRSIGAGRSSLGSGRCLRSTCPVPTSRWPSVGRRWRCGPTTSLCRSFALPWRDTGPTAGWRGSPSASCTKPGPTSTAARFALRSPVRRRRHRLAEETRQLRYVLAAKLAHAIAAAELGEEETADHLIADGRGGALADGRQPSALADRVRARAGGPRSRTAGRGVPQSRPHLRSRGPVLPALHARLGARRPRRCGRPRRRRPRPGSQSSGRVGGDRGGNDARRISRCSWPTRPRCLPTTRPPSSGSRSRSTSSAAGWPFYAARARLAYGGWLRRQRRGADSRTTTTRGRTGLRRPRPARFAERARRELRASGERARRRVPEAWTELSPQELQIAQLAAEGLSNREIGERLYLSHRTVSTHLYRLFPKLGITSRTQLRDALEPPHDS